MSWFDSYLDPYLERIRFCPDPPNQIVRLMAVIWRSLEGGGVEAFTRLEGAAPAG
jgi:hypothetical protein